MRVASLPMYDLPEVVKADPHFGTNCSPASRLRGPPPQRP